jgi:hypothetical protein
MKTVLIVAILLALAASPLVVPAAAIHCNGNVTAITSPDGSVTIYVDDRDITVGGIWVYQESNGVEGLQSGGESILLGADDADPCNHANPDTLIV